MTRRPTRNSASSSTTTSNCGICGIQVSKYRCSVCPVRYCSVACYKLHKASDCAGTVAAGAKSVSASTSTSTSAQAGPSGSQISNTPAAVHSESSTLTLQSDTENKSTLEQQQQQRSADRDIFTAPTPLSPLLKPLSELDWPPEPDEAIFTDPLMKEDPKPLRREELLRIATSSDLRTLLQTTSLPSILAILDSLPPSARHTSLSRILEIDNNSLSKPSTTSSLISGRDSPPPLDQLLNAIIPNPNPNPNSNDAKEEREGEGWFLRPGHGSSLKATWIGQEERKLMRLFAGSVCMAIDGTEHKEEQGNIIGWGDGNLEWEI